MTKTQTAQASYRKTKTGEWVVYGPAGVVRPGAVTVTKRDGTTKTEQVARTGKSFVVDGVAMVYGYTGVPAPASSRRRTDAVDHEDCLSFSSCQHGSSRCDYH